ncbi:hypothetical protein [Streptomyces sp. NPDC047043]|uniref:hypothetical protein n=1 Tax=Streptomyces sp. NPDC047043 TaxID=3154497 RepID=UPI0033C95CE1
MRFTEVVERWGGDGPSLVQRAYVRVRLGRPADALADLRSAERVGALDAEARWVLAALSGAAARDVARLLGAAARTAMGRAQGRSRAHDDWSRAAALLDRARQLDPGGRDFALPHAVALCLSGRRDDGLTVLTSASRSAPTDRRLAHNLALMAWHALTPADGETGEGGTAGGGSTATEDKRGGSRTGRAPAATGAGSTAGTSGANGTAGAGDEDEPGGARTVTGAGDTAEPRRTAGVGHAGEPGSEGITTAAGSTTPADGTIDAGQANRPAYTADPSHVGRPAGPGGSGSAGKAGSTTDPANAWKRCIALWGGLLHDSAFWERRRGEAAGRYGVAVGDKDLVTLRGDLQDRLEALMPEGDAGGRTSPEALLHREIEAARLLADAGGLPLATASGPLVCGPLRIVELGREPELGAFVSAAGDAAPALRQAFSHLGLAQALLRLDRPGEALAALSGLRCPSCRARSATSPNGTPAAVETNPPPTHTPTTAHEHSQAHPAQTPRRPDRAAVCDPGCVHFDARNPAYAGQAGRHRQLMLDGRALAMAARLAQGQVALTPVAPDVRTAAASWQKALVHARAIGQGAEVEAIVADTALGAAKALHRSGDINAAGATLEAAYALLDEGQHDRLKGQLARVLTERGITRANADMERLEAPAADLRRAVELNPHLHRAQVNLGVVLRILGARMRWSGSLVGARNKLKEAVDHLTDGLAHFPEDPELAELRDLVQDDLALVHSELEQGRIGGLPE